MRPIFAIFNFLRGLKTTKFHEVPAGTATKMYGEDINGNLVQDDVPSGGGGASAFTELSDVPESYTDQAGKMLIVNEDENGLEYTDSHTHTNKTFLDSLEQFGAGAGDVAEGNHTHSELHSHTNKEDLDDYDPDNFAASNHNHNLNDLTEKSYNSLTDKPTIPSGELEYFDEIRNTSTPNATVPAHQLIAKGDKTNIDIVLSPKGYGAILAHIPNSSTSGGNKRGQYSVDLQRSRDANTQVASGNYSVIGGGHRNTASGGVSVIGGGQSNVSSGPNSVVCGGRSNVASDDFAAVCGGFYNVASNDYAAVCSGYDNVASGTLSGILSGAYGIAMFYGQESHASGHFDEFTRGQIQRSDYVLSGDTLTTNYYRLFLDGGSDIPGLLIDLSQTGAYSTWQCKLKVTGIRRLTGSIDHYVSEHNFMIYRENGTPVIADFTEIHTHQVAASSVATGVSITTNSLAVDIVTTENNWQFVAHLETVETFTATLA